MIEPFFHTSKIFFVFPFIPIRSHLSHVFKILMKKLMYYRFLAVNFAKLLSRAFTRKISWDYF